MRLALCLLPLPLPLLLAGCAHAPSSPPGSSPPRCSPLTPEIRQRATAAEQFNLAGYHAALAEQALTPIALPERTYQGHDGAASDDEDPTRFHPVGTAFVEDGKTWIAGPFISVPSGDLPQASFEFVQNPAGEVFQLERRLEVQSRESALLCGCGPVGSGAAPHVEQVLYALPAGASFRGVVTIAYPVKRFDFEWSGTDGRGRPCQPPP